jgi:hypothetical protein
MAITNDQFSIAALAGALCVLWYIVFNLLTLIGVKK